MSSYVAPDPLEYRAGIVAVFTDGAGRVLGCKRKSSSREEWSFPQGGLEPGETPKDALYREVLEELGNHQFEIVRQAAQPLQYDFPPNANELKYRGQRHTWFLCQYKDGHQPELEKAMDNEFDAVSWTSPQEAPTRVIHWKRDAYERGLKELGFQL
jgi:putative (di)nucleoside polyphosphate hydrolase